MHAVPDYEHLLDIIEDVDAIEVFNPRVAFSAFNEEAVRFAAKYRIAAGAGSDAHVAQGLGTARVRMRDFDGPQEFLESLRGGEIVTLADELRLRAGAQVPADQGDARGRPPIGQATTRTASDRARPDARRGRRAEAVEPRVHPCLQQTTTSARSTSSAPSARSTR